MGTETTDQLRPVLIACPYLPLQTHVEFAGWWLGPLAEYDGPWRDAAFEAVARDFLAGFREVSGGVVDRPSLLVESARGADGRWPSEKAIEALELTVGFAAVDANPHWSPETRDQSWAVATSDNAEVWVQPLDPQDRYVAFERGGRVRVLSGGHRVVDDFSVPPPLELHMPSGTRLDPELLDAIYRILTAKNVSKKAKRLKIAIRWLLKSWRNSLSINEQDRLVFLKTASEALTGLSKSVEAARRLNALFRTTLDQEGEGIGVDSLLWSPDEACFERSWWENGARRTAELPAIEHWYLSFADARNQVVHDGSAGSLGYDQDGSPYSGPLVEVADRVLREAIKVALGNLGYPAVWRTGFSRASFHCLRRLRQGGSSGCAT